MNGANYIKWVIRMGEDVVTQEWVKIVGLPGCKVQLWEEWQSESQVCWQTCGYCARRGFITQLTKSGYL